MTHPSMPRVTVVGDAAMDVVVRPRDEITPGGDSPAETALTCGGAGANTARWLVAAGVGTVLASRVGSDAAGHLVRSELESAGVSCAFTVDPGAATACVVALVGKDGERSMLADRGACSRLSPSDVPRDVLAGATHLHLSGYVLLYEDSRAAGLAALAAAREAGLTTSVDPQAALLLTEPERFLADVHGVDLLLPNAAELAALTGSSDPESARALLPAVGAVVVTSGGDGAAFLDGAGETVTVTAERADCVDATGAGDAFNAGFLGAWLAGRSAADALRAGTRLGARAVSRVGAQPR